MSELLPVEPGQWVVTRRDSSWRSFEVVRADKVTAQQIRTIDADRRDGLTQRRSVVAACPDEESARQLVQRLDGCKGEYQRREQAARKACNESIERVLRDANRRIA